LNPERIGTIQGCVAALLSCFASRAHGILSPVMTLEDCRHFYAEEIRFLANITSPALVEAFARVPREKFVGPAPWQISSPEQGGLAALGMGNAPYITTDDPRDLYHNLLIALDPARRLNNGQPSALAHWINALNLKTGDRVFHLGCGVGYYTAIMAEVVGPNGKVVASEVDTDLASRARENLAGYTNVTVYAGDGAAFDPGTCDAMLINAGVTHPHLPWLERLAEGGRLVLPITAAIGTTSFGSGVMAKITRERGVLAAQVITFTAIFSCTSVRDPQLDPLLGKALATRTLLKLKSVRLDQHDPADTCVIHRRDVCLSSADPVAGHEALAS
jgi:protein-L-isoaspartate(D-aspartate) O-methyltransferase